MKTDQSIRERLKRSAFLVGLVQAFRHLPSDFRRIQWRRQRQVKIDRYLATTKSKKLQIGCGKNALTGWLNTDLTPLSDQVMFLDVTEPMPFSEASFDFVFSEHVIEHLTFADGQKMLREIFRVLKPGGIIRISTPNLTQIAGLMHEALDEIQEKYVAQAVNRYLPDLGVNLPAFVVNNFYWDFGHYFVYDPRSLTHAFTNIGFVKPQLRQSCKSDHPDLQGVESHGKVVGEDINRFESMIMEATKPSP